MLARHDPIPFIIKFLRTYNPALEERLEAWGLAALPKQYERERRFVNIYRKHDALRGLSDDEFSRIIGYSDNMIGLALDIMSKEKVVGQKALDDLAAIHETELNTEKEKLSVLKESRAKTKPQARPKAKSKAKPKPRKPKIDD